MVAVGPSETIGNMEHLLSIRVHEAEKNSVTNERGIGVEGLLKI